MNVVTRPVPEGISAEEWKYAATSRPSIASSPTIA